MNSLATLARTLDSPPGKARSRPIAEEADMTDDRPDDPQRDMEWLKAELAHKEREIEELKREFSRTKDVGDALWSHEIYLRARKKLAAGVTVVLVALSALGLVTVAQLYQRGVDYVDGEMKTQIASRITQRADDMVKEAGVKMDSRIDEHIGRLIADKKEEFNVLIADRKEEFNVLIATTEKKMDSRINEHIGSLIADKKEEINVLIADTKKEVDREIAQLKIALKQERVALSTQVRQTRIGMTAPAKAERLDTEIPRKSVDCDPNNLDDAQIARVGVRQLSVDTGRTTKKGRKVFKNTFFLDVRGTDETTDAAEASCIVDGVDRVVYGADPKWYSPSEFVRIDREHEFRFTISGWGPTELSAQVYFIGRRDPLRIQGNLTMTKAMRADKRYLGEAPPGEL